MSHNAVNVRIDTITRESGQSFEQQVRNDDSPVSAFVVAEMLGRALVALQPSLTQQPVDDIVYAFRKGYTGENK